MEQRKIQKRTIESREKINQAAFTLFSEKGYFNTNTKEIARLAGVSVGNFYNYYKDKSDVYFELTRQYVEGSATALLKLTEEMVAASNPKEMFRDYMHMQMNRAGTVGRFFMDSQILVNDDERFQVIFEENTQLMISAIEQMLSQLKGIKKRASYAVMARLLFTMINELSNDVMRTKGTPVYEEYLEQLTQMVLSYLYGDA